MKPNNSLLFLVIMLTTSIGIGQMSSYSNKIELKGIESQWHRIELPNEVFSKVRSNLADIRIYGITATDTIETPYFHKILKAVDTNSFVSMQPLNTVQNDQGYYYTIEVPTEETINEIRLNFRNLNFNWMINLEGSQNQQEWFSILNDYRILSIHNEQTDYSFTTLKFPNANFKYYRLLVKSQEKPFLESATVLKKAEMEAQYREYTESSFKVSEENKKTIIQVALKNKVPLDVLEITIDDEIDYYRPITIQYLADSVKTEKGYHYNYRTIATRTLTSIEENKFLLPGVLTQKIKIIISNHDNQPLKISKVQSKGYLQTLTARFTKPADYYLVYGNHNAIAPNYDITNTAISKPENMSKLSFGDITEIQKPMGPTTKPLFENKWWLWLIIGFIILSLSYFTIRMMKKEI